MSLGTHVHLCSAQPAELTKVQEWFCLHYYGCVSLKSLSAIRRFQSIFGQSAVSVGKIYWHYKEMHTQQNLFSGNQDESDEILFSCTSDFLHLVKITLNLVTCFFLVFSEFPSEQQTGWYRKPEENSITYLFNLKSSINHLLFCLQLNRKFVLIIVIAMWARARNRLNIKST